MKWVKGSCPNIIILPSVLLKLHTYKCRIKRSFVDRKKKKNTKPGEFHHGVCSPVSSLGASHLSSLFSFSPSPLSFSRAPPWRCLDNKSQRMPLSFHCLCFPQPPLACHYITHPHTSIHTVHTHAHTNKRALTNIQKPSHTLVYQVVTELHFDW